MRASPAWRIFDPKTRTYYAGPSGIGPRFGATKKTALTFVSARGAVLAMKSHSFAFEGCQLELPNGRLRSEVPGVAGAR